MTQRRGGEDFPPRIHRSFPPMQDLAPRACSDTEFPEPLVLPTTPESMHEWRFDKRATMLYREGAWYLVPWKKWKDVVTAAKRGAFRPLLTLPKFRPGILIERMEETSPPDNLRLREEPDGEILYKILDQSWWCDWKAPVDWRLEAEEIRRRDLRAPFLEDERRKAELLSLKLCPPDDTIGWVYLMQPEKGGPIKIGWSLDVRPRLKKLSYEYGEKLILVDWTAGTKNDELQLHRALQRFMLPYRPGHGTDWFADVETVRDACQEIGMYRKMNLKRAQSFPVWDKISEAMVFGDMEHRDPSRPRRRDARSFRRNVGLPKREIRMTEFFIEDPTRVPHPPVAGKGKRGKGRRLR